MVSSLELPVGKTVVTVAVPPSTAFAWSFTLFSAVSVNGPKIVLALMATLARTAAAKVKIFFMCFVF